MDKQEKNYKEGRFEFTVYVNDHIICKRNFSIPNYIENSMNTEEFKSTVDDIVRLVDNDLKSKSRVYTWHFYNPMPEQHSSEFSDPLLKPWECTFKLVISDNHRDVISKIWDGYAYPKFVRDKVDLTNKNVRIVTRDGNVQTYDKDSFFKGKDGKLSIELETIKGMILDKPDELYQITRMICDTCGAKDYASKKDAIFTTSGVYRNVDYARDENGNAIIAGDSDTVLRKTGPSRKYSYRLKDINRKFISDWGKAVSEKTKTYQNTLY